MGFTGARTAGAVGGLANRLGSAFMNIGARQQDDERNAEVMAYRKSVDAANNKRYDTQRMDALRAQGYDIQEPSSTALGRAMMHASTATGSDMPSYTVGQRDATKSFAFEDAKAVSDLQIAHAQERSQAAIRNLYSGPNTVQDYELPAAINQSVTGDALYKALEIVQRHGEDRASALEEVGKIPGIFGRKVHDGYNSIVGARALADLTKDGKEPRTGFRPNDGALVNLDTGAVIAPGVPKPGGGGAPDLTLDQGKSVSFYQRGRPALDIIEKLSRTFGGAQRGMSDDVARTMVGGPGRLGRAAGSVPIFGNMLKSADLQMYDQAVNDFGMAVLRKDSGATITADEQDLVRKTYIPSVGDSPQAARQKLDAAARAIESLRSTAGPGASLMGAPPAVRRGGITLPDDPDAAAEYVKRGGM